MKHKPDETWQGFEQGPIRPPSEAQSLLIRVTRNCPWNRCTFCPVYKGARFSLRPVDHVIKDIDSVFHYVEKLNERSSRSGYSDRSAIQEIAREIPDKDAPSFHAAVNWMLSGASSIFLQDANSLVMKSGDLIQVLTHLKSRFPWVKRITSYARSHTIARMKEDDLAAMRNAGLNRIHIGLESGADRVLDLVKKGSTKAMHIKAGLKVKQAGMELSEYVMPGLGGREHSREHALETADALNQINPDFIRLRTLAIPNFVPLFEAYQSGAFTKCTDREMAEEILLFIQTLDGITSMVKSDHMLNLFEEVKGRLPQDKPKMTAVVESFLGMDPHRQCLYQVGRRIGIFRRLSDMENTDSLKKAHQFCRENRISPENADLVIEELMKRFI